MVNATGFLEQFLNINNIKKKKKSMKDLLAYKIFCMIKEMIICPKYIRG